MSTGTWPSTIRCTTNGHGETRSLSHTTTTRLRQVLRRLLLSDQIWRSLAGDHLWVASLGGGVSGGCRSMLRHEQQSIRMALATVMHHSFKVHIEHGAPRSQTTATRAREGEAREQHYGLRAQERPLPRTRPAPLLEVLPQVGAQRHAVDQIDAVPTLDGPVLLMVEQLVDVLQLFDALIPVAEQDIDVPNIFIERIPPRTLPREPQLAEQLVEVPTIVSFSSLQRIMEQTVDIAVPQGGGRIAGPQGFFPGQSSTAQARISARLLEQMLEQATKRRKKRVPRSSSHSSCGRARRRQLQRACLHCWFSW